MSTHTRNISYQPLHAKTNYRTWKSKKNWLYATSALAVIVAGGTATQAVLPVAVVHAGTVITQSGNTDPVSAPTLSTPTNPNLSVQADAKTGYYIFDPTAQGVTVTDPSSTGTPTPTVTATNAADSTNTPLTPTNGLYNLQAGTYTVTYSYTNGNSSATPVTQTITVAPLTPTLTLASGTAGQIITQGAPFVPDATVEDANQGQDQGNLSNDSATVLGTNPAVGTYTVTYTYTYLNSMNTQTSVTIPETVVVTATPSISTASGAQGQVYVVGNTFNPDATVIDPNAATDGGVLTNDAATSVNTSQAGNYTVTYTYNYTDPATSTPATPITKTEAVAVVSEAGNAIGSLSSTQAFGVQDGGSNNGSVQASFLDGAGNTVTITGQNGGGSLSNGAYTENTPTNSPVSSGSVSGTFDAATQTWSFVLTQPMISVTGSVMATVPANIAGNQVYQWQGTDSAGNTLEISVTQDYSTTTGAFLGTYSGWYEEYNYVNHVWTTVGAGSVTGTLDAATDTYQLTATAQTATLSGSVTGFTNFPFVANTGYLWYINSSGQEIYIQNFYSNDGTGGSGIYSVYQNGQTISAGTITGTLSGSQWSLVATASTTGTVTGSVTSSSSFPVTSEGNGSYSLSFTDTAGNTVYFDGNQQGAWDSSTDQDVYSGPINGYYVEEHYNNTNPIGVSIVSTGAITGTLNSTTNTWSFVTTKQQGTATGSIASTADFPVNLSQNYVNNNYISTYIDSAGDTVNISGSQSYVNGIPNGIFTGNYQVVSINGTVLSAGAVSGTLNTTTNVWTFTPTEQTGTASGSVTSTAPFPVSTNYNDITTFTDTLGNTVTITGLELQNESDNNTVTGIYSEKNSSGLTVSTGNVIGILNTATNSWSFTTSTLPQLVLASGTSGVQISTTNWWGGDATVADSNRSVDNGILTNNISLIIPRNQYGLYLPGTYTVTYTYNYTNAAGTAQTPIKATEVVQIYGISAPTYLNANVGKTINLLSGVTAVDSQGNKIDPSKLTISVNGTVLPAGTTTYTPTNSDLSTSTSGGLNVSYSYVDPNGSTIVANTYYNVLPALDQVPTITAPAAGTGITGSAINLAAAVSGVDSEGNLLTASQLTISVDGTALPAGATTYTPAAAGTYTVDYSYTDPTTNISANVVETVYTITDGTPAPGTGPNLTQPTDTAPTAEADSTTGLATFNPSAQGVFVQNPTNGNGVLPTVTVVDSQGVTRTANADDTYSLTPGQSYTITYSYPDATSVTQIVTVPAVTTTVGNTQNITLGAGNTVNITVGQTYDFTDLQNNLQSIVEQALEAAYPSLASQIAAGYLDQTGTLSGGSLTITNNNVNNAVPGQYQVDYQTGPLTYTFYVGDPATAWTFNISNMTLTRTVNVSASSSNPGDNGNGGSTPSNPAPASPTISQPTNSTLTVQADSTSGLYSFDPTAQGVKVTDPANSSAKATVSVADSSGNALSPSSNGIYSLKAGSYTVTYSYTGATSVTQKVTVQPVSASPATTSIYRLYNPISGQHLLSSAGAEILALTIHGWLNEGVMVNTPSTGTAVYRLYNPTTGEHLYSKDTHEISTLTQNGWINEGITFYSGGTVPVYRLYNPTTNTHLYSTDPHEVSVLTSHGFKNEGIAYYAESN